MMERPILLSGPEVRAVLAGRKTQTRRLVKLTDAGRVKETNGHRNWHLADPDAAMASPYGQPGDRLWVRETWCNRQPFYFADLAAAEQAEHWRVRRICGKLPIGQHWRSPVTMPRWASRLTLEIVAVRVQRLQEISEDDARAEDVPPGECGSNWTDGQRSYGGAYEKNFRSMFPAAWDECNGKRAPWSSNPWVWAITFKVALGVVQSQA